MAVQYLQRLFNIFYKKHQNKSTAISRPINFILPVAKSIIKPCIEHLAIKQKCGQAIKAEGANKYS